MRIGISLPNYGRTASAANLAQLARLAEELGFDSVWLSDHLVAPVGVASIYPYDRRPEPKPGAIGVLEEFFEPVVTLAWIAGQTRRVRLGISAYVMPYRNPVLTAKQIATLDVLSGGRVILGVGVGWLAEEFAALGVPFAKRGARTEEYIAICTGLWAGGEVSFEGEHYRLPPVRTGPRPAQRPRPPVWIAGNSTAAIARAARVGDGWHAIDLSPDELRSRVAHLHHCLETQGRPATAVTVSLRRNVDLREPALRGAASPTDRLPLSGDKSAIQADLAAYRDAGLDYLVANARRGRDVDELAHAMREVASAVDVAPVER